MSVSARDICARAGGLYRCQRDEHRATSVGPDGTAHDVDVLRLLCLSELVDYELNLVEVHGGGVFAKEAIEAGDVATFYPGDAVAQYPTAGTDISLRLMSDRMRRLGGEVSMSDAIEAGDGFRIAGHPSFEDDPSYLGHLITTGPHANCRLEVLHDVAVAVVAAVGIEAGEELKL